MVILIKYITTRYIMVKITVVINLTQVRFSDSADKTRSHLKLLDLLNYYKIIKMQNRYSTYSYIYTIINVLYFKNIWLLLVYIQINIGNNMNNLTIVLSDTINYKVSV